MSSVNRATLIGFLGKDAEVSQLPSGVTIVKASIATSERFKDKSGQLVDKTEWHRLNAIGDRFKGVSKYLLKGTRIYVEGKIQYREWEDKNKVKRSTTEIMVSDIVLLGDKAKSGHPDQAKFDDLMQDMINRPIESQECPF